MLLQGRCFTVADRSRAAGWAAHLLRQLGARAADAGGAPGTAPAPGAGGIHVAGRREVSVAARWAASGLLGLAAQERPAASVMSSVDVVTAADGAAAAFTALAAARGRRLRLDGAALLGERAAAAGLYARRGASAGGSTRMLRCADGWAALGLRRDEDRELIPALLGRPGAGEWSDIAAWAAAVPSGALVERAQLLGLPAAEVLDPERMTARVNAPWTVTAAGRLPDTETPLVVDLAALWAGPLAASLLARAGARVVKVETPRRPDGARSGPAAFYDLLNAGKESVVCEPGDRLLTALLDRAAVVVTSARPRALEQLGWTPRRDQTWLTVTGYGWTGPRRDWVAFGDEAAVAAGVRGGSREAPEFCADAVADPLTGLHAAVAAQASLVSGVAAHIDISLFQVAAHLAATLNGPLPEVRGPVSPLRIRTPTGHAAAPGADTARLTAEL